MTAMVIGVAAAMMLPRVLVSVLGLEPQDGRDIPAWIDIAALGGSILLMGVAEGTLK